MRTKEERGKYYQNKKATELKIKFSLEFPSSRGKKIKELRNSHYQIKEIPVP